MFKALNKLAVHVFGLYCTEPENKFTLGTSSCFVIVVMLRESSSSKITKVICECFSS